MTFSADKVEEMSVNPRNLKAQRRSHQDKDDHPTDDVAKENSYDGVVLCINLQPQS